MFLMAAIRPSVLDAMQKIARLLEPVVRSVRQACPQGMDLAYDSLWNIFLSGDVGRAWDKFLPGLGRDQLSSCLDGLVKASRSTLWLKCLRANWRDGGERFLMF